MKRTYHYQHPLRSEAILKNALKWFGNSIEWTKPGDESAVAQLHLAHCLFELGDFVGALKAYECIDEDVFVNTDEDESITILRERLAACREIL